MTKNFNRISVKKFRENNNMKLIVIPATSMVLPTHRFIIRLGRFMLRDRINEKLIIIYNF